MSDPALTHDPPETLAAIHSLDEAMAEPEPLDWEHPIEPESLSRANRIARGLARSEREEAAVRAAALAQITEVQQWQDAELARIARSKGWFVRSLEAFARNSHERGGPKSVRLATGHTLSLSKARGHVEVLDEAEFLAWALGCANCSHGPHVGDCSHLAAYGNAACGCNTYGPSAPRLVRETAPKPAEQHAAKTEIGKLPSYAGALLLDGEIVPGVAWDCPDEDVFKIDAADG